MIIKPFKALLEEAPKFKPMTLKMHPIRRFTVRFNETPNERQLLKLLPKYGPKRTLPFRQG